MGFFDFLHGKQQKSEAQIYMEQRNGEYAKRVAEYKRREALQISGNKFNMLDDSSRRKTSNKSPQSITKKIVKHISDELHANIPISAHSSTSNNSHNNIYKKANDCESCHTTTNIYNGEEDVLEVARASANASLRTVIASGTIVRGGFSVGDVVTVITSLETREATISGIWRQGEKIDYANISSGPVGVVLANSADMMIRAGDKIVKNKKRLF